MSPKGNKKDKKQKSKKITTKKKENNKTVKKSKFVKKHLVRKRSSAERKSKLHPAKKSRARKQKKEREYVKTGIKGFDDMLENGIRKGHCVLLSGGAGSGKTIMGLHILANAAKQGKKCLYMSFEESEEQLREHMEDFGWHPEELEKKGNLVIKRLSIFDISRSLDALLAKAKGELLIDIKPIILPQNFKPDFLVIDSLTAIASTFGGKESYRSYIENLFRYISELGITSFFITETEEMPTVFSPTGVEEFLADGVITMYNVRKGDIRESAIEIIKMRGIKHVKKVVAMRIVPKVGIEIYPEQEVFGGIK